MKHNVIQILFLKLEQGDVRKVGEILKQSPHLIDMEHPKTGQTPLSVATRRNDGSMIEQLIQLRANVNKSNKFNQSPLWIASFYNFKRTADFLISKKADPNIPDKKGFTPLMIAAQRGNLEIIALLLNAGADEKLMNKNHDSVFDLSKDYETLQFIIQTLQLDEVHVKQPEKFKHKICSSQKSTQSRFSTATPLRQDQYKHEKSESMPNLENTTYPLHDLINSLCEEIQLIVQEQIQNFKDFILQESYTVSDAQKRITKYFDTLQPNLTTTEDVQFQYDNFQFESSQLIGRTIYSILHHLGRQCTEQRDNTKSPSPKSKYMSHEPLIEATELEEQSTPMSEFRNILKKIDTPSTNKEPLKKSRVSVAQSDLQYQMTLKLESLNDLINQRISNLKL